MAIIPIKIKIGIIAIYHSRNKFINMGYLYNIQKANAKPAIKLDTVQTHIPHLSTSSQMHILTSLLLILPTPFLKREPCLNSTEPIPILSA